MLRIDAHQHFWKFDPVRDSWINEEMKQIQRDFLPGDLAPVLQRNRIDGCVAVQSDQSLKENDFHLRLAADNHFIKGIVGWVDLQSDNIEEQLQELSRFKKIKGFRHVLQAEPDPDFMLRSAFIRGIRHLRQFNFTYDILIYPKHLGYAKQLVADFPDQRFVIDHLAKPLIKSQVITGWKEEMEAIALHKNVSCKISGMVTEADWKRWQKEDFNIYLDTVFEAFGSKRIMFGSDWPVCLVAASYEKMMEIVTDYTANLSTNEQADFWGGNAIEIYNLI